MLIRIRTWATDHLPLVLVLGVFAASRTLIFALGVRFDATSVDYFLQFIDPELLRTRLWESLFYLHSQPPLFNFLLGVGLKLFPDHFAGAMHALFLSLGLAQAVGTYLLLVRLGVGQWASAGVAVALSVMPATLLYENWLFYEYPVVTLLIASGLAFREFVRRGTVWAGATFFTLVAALVYLRSIFQVVWLLLIVGVIVLLRRDLARTTIVSAFPLLAVGLLLAKNVIVFGVPTTSSWFGMNLAQVVHSQVSPAERKELVARGELSPVSALYPFQATEDYAEVVSVPPLRGIPVLDEDVKSTGAPNMNHLLLIDVSRDYFKDAIRLMWLRPRAYPAAILEGTKLYFQSATTSDFVASNRDDVNGYVKVFDRVVLLRAGSAQIAWTLVLAHAVALLYGLVRTTRVIRRRIEATPEALTFSYVWVTLLYVTVLVTVTQVAENNRIRFFLDPLVVILLSVGVRDLIRRFRRGSEAGRAGARPAPVN